MSKIAVVILEKIKIWYKGELQNKLNFLMLNKIKLSN